MISAILNIGQKVDRDWPLHIQDNQGNHHQVCSMVMMMTMMKMMMMEMITIGIGSPRSKQPGQPSSSLLNRNDDDDDDGDDDKKFPSKGNLGAWGDGLV